MSVPTLSKAFCRICLFIVTRLRGQLFRVESSNTEVEFGVLKVSLGAPAWRENRLQVLFSLCRGKNCEPGVTGIRILRPRFLCGLLQYSRKAVPRDKPQIAH